MFNNCKTIDDIINLCHELFDKAKIDTPWTRKFFYNLDGIKKTVLNPKYAYERAIMYVHNANMRGQGLGMDRGRYMHEDENYDDCLDAGIEESMDDDQKKEFEKKLRAGKVKFKYKKVDGKERTAVGTMDPKLMDLPEKKKQADVDKAEAKNIKKRKLPKDSVFYYDLEKNGFRSFKMSNFIDYV